MPRKPKFRPVITRIKLNPEQAVLTCNCYSRGMMTFMAYIQKGRIWPNPICQGGKSVNGTGGPCDMSGSYGHYSYGSTANGSS